MFAHLPSRNKLLLENLIGIRPFWQVLGIRWKGPGAAPVESPGLSAQAQLIRTIQSPTVWGSEGFASTKQTSSFQVEVGQKSLFAYRLVLRRGVPAGTLDATEPFKALFSVSPSVHLVQAFWKVKLSSLCFQFPPALSCPGSDEEGRSDVP